MDYAHTQKPDLPYLYEFPIDHLEAAIACTDKHGFAIIQDVLPDDLVAELRASVIAACDPDNALAPGQSFTHTSWVETSPKAWQLMDHEPFMRIHQAFTGTDQMTINRSACILRNPGSQAVGWHTDWRGFADTPPTNTGDVLNRGDWPSGKWFYITGSRPVHGGLCIIEDSHVEDWEGPEGFNLTKDRGSFYPQGEEEHRYNGFDIPGLVPLFTDPGDMIVFAHRTYHGAFPNKTDEVRLSCAIGFRRKDHHIDAPWPLPETSKQFIEALPEHLKPYTEGYTGLDRNWRA
jgi:hypothetical protein